MKNVAIVYDRVNKWGGAERVLLALHEIFPEAPLYTSVYSNEKASWAKVFPEVHTSFIQQVPFLTDKHHLIPYIMPLAFESLDLSNYKTVISVTSEAAKGIITGPNTKHICYCLTPTRYLWSGYDTYFDKNIMKKATYPVVSYLQRWDKIGANRPDQIIAISSEVSKRIKKYYKRDSRIVHPPVDTNFFTPINTKKEEYFLIVSRLVPYKKVDLAIKAFNLLNIPLVIVGTGSELSKLKRMAKNNIHFVDNINDSVLRKYYNKSQALIFPQEEDFGIVAAEAQSCGLPVIAYKKGGSLDIVKDKVTGLFFERQDVKSLIESLYHFKKMRFDANKINRNAQRFSKEKFKSKFLEILKI